jgi:hypothetical protein
VLTSCYLINRLPSRILSHKSPLEILYDRKVNISHLKVFECTCLAMFTLKMEENLTQKHTNVYLLVIILQRKDTSVSIQIQNRCIFLEM